MFGNKPANGVAREVGAVMGADSWPPVLSKSACGSSTESLKELSHGSLTLSMEVAAPNHESPCRQWSMERDGGSLSHNNATANDSFSQAPYSHCSVVEESHFSRVKSSSSAGGSPRNNTNGNAGQRGGSYSGHEPHQPGGPFRWYNIGPRLQVNGSFNRSHRSKLDQGHGKQNWSNTNRSFGSRINLAPQQRVASMPFIRGPLSNAPFVSPPPPLPVDVRRYGPPVFYNGSLRQMPMVPSAPMFYPMSDHHLTYKIVSQ